MLPAAWHPPGLRDVLLDIINEVWIASGDSHLRLLADWESYDIHGGKAMITVGVDLAAEPAKTAVAVLSWDSAGAAVTDLILKATNETILQAALNATKVGIDCPLGWPRQFVDFISRHEAGMVGSQEAQNVLARKPLVYRRTDLHLIEHGGPTPLSVSTDRIGNAAMRVAGLLAVWEQQDGFVDRSGAGRVVEVYPAGALRRWGFNSRQYKGKLHETARKALVDSFFAATTQWLVIPESLRALCEVSDDAFDAVIAALNARAATVPSAVSVPKAADDIAAARLEGWIAVPTGDLADLDPRR